MSHTEKLMRLLYEQIITALIQNKFTKPESFVGELRNTIVSFKIQLTTSLYESQSFEKVDLEQKIIKLRLSLYGENRYQYIRPKAFTFTAYNSESSMHSSCKINKEEIKEKNREKKRKQHSNEEGEDQMSSSSSSSYRSAL